jgi:hypothetical protein
MAKKKTTDEPVETTDVLKFTKKQFVNSQRFAKRRDLVNALLDDDETYSIEEVELKINNFLNGKNK